MLIECLREVPAEDLAIADGITIFAGPVVDGTTLLDDPLTLIASGQVQRKDSIIGNPIIKGYDAIPLLNTTQGRIQNFS